MVFCHGIFDRHSDAGEGGHEWRMDLFLKVTWTLESSRLGMAEAFRGKQFMDGLGAFLFQTSSNHRSAMASFGVFMITLVRC